jgi:hypothetical protein
VRSINWLQSVNRREYAPSLHTLRQQRHRFECYPFDAYSSRRIRLEAFNHRHHGRSLNATESGRTLVAPLVHRRCPVSMQSAPLLSRDTRAAFGRTATSYVGVYCSASVWPSVAAAGYRRARSRDTHLRKRYWGGRRESSDSTVIVIMMILDDSLHRQPDRTENPW